MRHDTNPWIVFVLGIAIGLWGAVFMMQARGLSVSMDTRCRVWLWDEKNRMSHQLEYDAIERLAKKETK